VHQFNRPDITLQGPDAPKPYYGNSVQPKCNRPDAALLYKAFSAILGRRLQLTVPTLGQAVRTLSGILVITFYLNIGLGRNWRRWKANEILYKLMVQMAINYRPDGPEENSRITFRTRKTLPVRTALAPVRTRVPQNQFLTRFWVSEAYK
jgi:hypothetical protein